MADIIAQILLMLLLQQNVKFLITATRMVECINSLAVRSMLDISIGRFSAVHLLLLPVWDMSYYLWQVNQIKLSHLNNDQYVKLRLDAFQLSALSY